jgi:hypothetical protein
MLVFWIFAWVLLALLDNLFTLVSFPLAPLVAAFADKDGNLPRALRWFQTFDAPLDAGWRDGYFAHTGTPTGFALWWLRVRWLWRNPGYGFGYYVAGIAFDPAAWRVVHFSTDGTSSTFIATDGRHFNIALGRSWLSLKIGWKAWNYFDAPTQTFRTTPWGPEMRTMICSTFRPW